MRTCSVEECENKYYAKGYCKKHYDRWLKYGDPLTTKTEMHGKENTLEYRVWQSMKQRCYNPKTQSYKNYGGRGIEVCNKWLHSFVAFYEDMGEKPFQRATIDRIDNDGNYELSNCRWTTNKINCRNARYAKLTMEIAQQIRKEYIPYVMTQKMLAKKYNVDKSTISSIIIRRTWI